MKVFIKGLNSCVMRKQKLQQYCDFLLGNGHEVVETPDASDAILIWTCAFRGDVQENSLREIERYEKECAGKKIIVAGCLPDISPALLREKFSGTVINWRQDREKMEGFFGAENVKLDQVLPIYVEKPVTDDVQKYRKENPDQDASFHDQFVKLVISEGCNLNCAYCSEKLMFPAYRSFPADRLVGRCREMVEGTKKSDVVLLADNVGEYGHDIGSSLPELIKDLKSIGPQIRIAVHNLNPLYFIRYRPEMIRLLQEGTVIHLTLPIQSASGKLLQRMNRGYGRDDLEEVFNSLEQVEFSAWETHLIVGFPGETEEDIDETIRFLLRYRPKYVLASLYMEAPGAPSVQLAPKVCLRDAKRRINRIEEDLKSAGIICNSSDSPLMEERLFRLNKTPGYYRGHLPI